MCAVTHTNRYTDAHSHTHRQTLDKHQEQPKSNEYSHLYTSHKAPPPSSRLPFSPLPFEARAHISWKGELYGCGLATISFMRRDVSSRGPRSQKGHSPGSHKGPSPRSSLNCGFGAQPFLCYSPSFSGHHLKPVRRQQYSASYSKAGHERRQGEGKICGKGERERTGEKETNGEKASPA